MDYIFFLVLLCWLLGDLLAWIGVLSMDKFEQSAMVAICGVLKEIVMAERERSREALEERERKWREKKERGPSNGNKLGPTWIESGFESGLDSKTGRRLNSNLAWDPHKIQIGISILTQILCTKHLSFSGTQWLWIWITKSGFESRVPNTHLLLAFRGSTAVGV